MAKAAQKPLGELESAILSVLWDGAGKLSVRKVHESLEREQTLAYTTVMTVLDRLFDKGLVARDKDGKAFVYWPVLSREQYLGEHARSSRAHRARGAGPARRADGFSGLCGARRS